MFDKNGEFSQIVDFKELYDAIKLLPTNYYAVNDKNMISSILDFEEIVLI